MKRVLTIALILLTCGTAAGAATVNEIRFFYDSGNTLYAIVRHPSFGTVWDTTLNAFVTWSDGDIANYDIALTDKSGDLYLGNFPKLITSVNVYPIVIYQQAGGAPATTDVLVGAASVDWDGTDERSLSGVKLDATGLDAISVKAPSGVATNFREMLIQLYRRFFAKTVLSTIAGTLTTYADDGATVVTTQSVNDTGTSQTMGAAQ